MRIRCELLSVETTGDKLTLRYQGTQPLRAERRPLLTGTVEVPNNPTTQRAYYVGRTIYLEVTPE